MKNKLWKNEQHKSSTKTYGNDENREERGRKLSSVLQGSSSVILEKVHLSQVKVQSKSEIKYGILVQLGSV
jgi:hypothetical protein